VGGRQSRIGGIGSGSPAVTAQGCIAGDHRVAVCGSRRDELRPAIADAESVNGFSTERAHARRAFTSVDGEGTDGRSEPVTEDEQAAGEVSNLLVGAEHWLEGPPSGP